MGHHVTPPISETTRRAGQNVRAPGKAGALWNSAWSLILSSSGGPTSPELLLSGQWLWRQGELFSGAAAGEMPVRL